MTASTAEPAAPPRFEPSAHAPEARAARCSTAVPAGDRDPHPGAHRSSCSTSSSSALPWLEPGLPHRRARRAGRRRPGICPALVGSIQLAIIVGAHHLPDRHRRRHLPRRVRAGQPAQPAARDEHQQPGRRAVDHLRHLRAGDLRPAAGPRPDVLFSGAADPRPGHPAARHHRQHRGAQGGARRRSAKAPTPSARGAGRWSGARSCRRPRPGS